MIRKIRATKLTEPIFEYVEFYRNCSKPDSVKYTLGDRVYGFGHFYPQPLIFMISSWEKVCSSLLYASIGVLNKANVWCSYTTFKEGVRANFDFLE